MSDRFVCAMNRGRDGYQVPLALHEAGLLEAFVTDFYAPDRPPTWLPDPLRRRRVRGLPSRATISSPASFMLQSAAQLARLPMTRVFQATDAMLGRHAGRVARRRHANLYCYAGYMPGEREIPPGTRRGLFEYHPLPGLQWEVLSADFARFPQVQRSFQEERNHAEGVVPSDDWKRADAVACASAFTKRSLVHAGCDPARVTVVPYGFGVAGDRPASGVAGPVPVRAGGGPCRFLFVGQGLQRKGLHHLVQVWQAADLPDATLTLVCYRIDPGIKAMIRSPSIRLLDRQTKEELDRLYSEADIFVMPSLVEGFGLVYLEALARGCHVIGTENSGLPDLVLPPEAATLVPVGDLDALAAALGRTRVMAEEGRLSREGIVAAASRWRWADFRNAIADHARALLAA